MTDRRTILAGLTGLSTSAALAMASSRLRAQSEDTSVSREAVTVLGTGHFGGSLGKRLGSLGYPVVYGSRTPDTARVRELVAQSGPRASADSLKGAAAQGSIVVFAIPWEPVKDLVPELGSLASKLLIDPMIAKPIVVDGYPFPSQPALSTAEQLQAWYPEAHVVKAFISISYGALADPTRAGGPISVPYAGTTGVSKQRVSRLISELGLEPIDTGPLACSRHLENLLWFEVAVNHTNKRLFELDLKKMPS